MKQHSTLRIFIRALSHSVLIAMALLYLFPLVATLLAAFRSDGDILRNGFLAIPQPWNVGGFSAAWEQGSLGVLLRNSALITLFSVPLTVACASLSGYALSRFRFRFRTGILLLFMSGMFFPPQVYIIPIYMLANTLGVYDAFAGLILVHLAYQLPFSTLFLLGFFRALPTALLDAARIDGAGEVRILLRIVLPLSKSALGAMAILLFTWIWNDFFWGLSMTQSLGTRPIMLGLASFSGRLAFNWNTQAAASLIALLPPLMVFCIFQRSFMKGVRMGAVK